MNGKGDKWRGGWTKEYEENHNKIFKKEKEMKEYSIIVNLTEEDLSQLQSGELYFDWSFPTEEDKDIIINVRLTTGEENE